MESPAPARKRLSVEPFPGVPREIGAWLWALEDVRRRLKALVADLSPPELDWLPPHVHNSIGTLLYHIAATEIDWMYDLLPHPPPSDVLELLPYPYHTSEGRLTPVRGVTLAEHLERLRRTRELLLAHYQGMQLEEFHRIHTSAQAELTPEWVLYHLLEHESLHRGQIATLRSGARLALGSQTGAGEGSRGAG